MAATASPSIFVCAFRSLSEAQSAVHDLIDSGISRESISVAAGDSKGEFSKALPNTGDVKKTTDGTTVGQNVSVGAGIGALGGLLLGLGALAIPGIGPIIAAGPLAATLGGAITGAAGGGIIGALKDAGVPDDDAEFYNETIRTGGALVTVHADRTQENQIDEVLSRHNSVQVGERERESPATGIVSTAPVANPPVQKAQPAQQSSREVNTGHEAIPVVEEELAIGKREVERGRTRVYTRIVETPVEEQINLREERISVQRRAVDRPATEADIAAFGEKSIELTEVSEEAVVGKQARVVEEVVVGKETAQRTETVRDTVRRTDVRVENLPDSAEAISYDADFRTDFQTRFGKVKGAAYETYAPAYQHGHTMASHPQSRGQKWSDVESQVKTDYLKNYPNSAWDNIKGAVRYGWEKVTGQH